MLWSEKRAHLGPRNVVVDQRKGDAGNVPFVQCLLYDLVELWSEGIHVRKLTSDKFNVLESKEKTAVEKCSQLIRMFSKRGRDPNGV